MCNLVSHGYFVASSLLQCNTGVATYAPEKNALVWKIKSFPVTYSPHHLLHCILSDLLHTLTHACTHTHEHARTHAHTHREEESLCLELILGFLVCVGQSLLLLLLFTSLILFYGWCILTHCSFISWPEEGEGRPPITVKFEIPYFTTSGIQVSETCIHKHILVHTQTQHFHLFFRWGTWRYWKKWLPGIAMVQYITQNGGKPYLHVHTLARTRTHAHTFLLPASILTTISYSSLDYQLRTH